MSDHRTFSLFGRIVLIAVLTFSLLPNAAQAQFDESPRLEKPARVGPLDPSRVRADFRAGALFRRNVEPSYSRAMVPFVELGVRRGVGKRHYLGVRGFVSGNLGDRKRHSLPAAGAQIGIRSTAGHNLTDRVDVEFSPSLFTFTETGQVGYGAQFALRTDEMVGVVVGVESLPGSNQPTPWPRSRSASRDHTFHAGLEFGNRPAKWTAATYALVGVLALIVSDSGDSRPHGFDLGWSTY